MDDAAEVAEFLPQMKQTLGYFSHPLLSWVLVFFVIGYSLEHVPYEFYQPYIKLLGTGELTGWLADQSAPMISAVVMSISMFGGAIGAAVSNRLMNRIGLRAVLLASIGIQLVIIGGLSVVLHPIMLILFMFRNFSMSMAHGPMLGAIAPHVPSAQRATLLSFFSLGGRAGFSVVLALLSVFVVGTDALNWPALAQVLATSLVIGVLSLAALAVWSKSIKQHFQTND